ncbi:uncharacterized protein LOC133901242 isoform X2 [Phragmites australis]|uniref:uncharacterized protein LOC133901242 isoform X2 n=1 Tax=Phragmites australis TaxID=29695 RepID=UPI002D792A7C|nr:uncharacterized protein LOC133901242 isoform X2 [Phragmites australis]
MAPTLPAKSRKQAPSSPRCEETKAPPTGSSASDPAAPDGHLDRKQRVGAKELGEKKRSLKRRYDRDAKKAAPPAGDHERRLYFSRDVWGGHSPPKPQIRDRAAEEKSAGVLTSNDAAQAKSAGDLPPTAEAKNAGEQTGKDALAPKARTLAEMHELYPCLVDEAMVLVDPADLGRVLPSIGDCEAQALDKNIKKMRMQLTKAITESARMKNMEMRTAPLCASTKLQPEKLRAENENNLLFDRLDKTDDMDICAQGRLARVEHEIVELRQIVIASQSQAKIESNPRYDNSSVKGIRCESTGSGLQSIVAENQIPCNILQKKMAAPNSLSHTKDEEVTSKYYCALPRNVLCNNKLQGMLPPKRKFHGRRRKIDAESQTPCNAGGKEVVLLSIVRPHTPVAKAILQTSSQSAIVGGTRLGTQCCMVFVSDVLQGDAPLLRPYGNMKKMFDALKCSIAWPREQIRDNTIASRETPVQSSHHGQ